MPDQPYDFAQILRTAVGVYLRGSPRPAPEGLTQTIGNLLDNLMGYAHRFDEPDLAGCLLILALARRDRADGLAVCLRALRHALDDLRLELLLVTELQPLRPAGRYATLPIVGLTIDLERARDLCAVLSEIGFDVPLETAVGYTPEQAAQAEAYALRLKARLHTPVDVPERPSFLSLL